MISIILPLVNMPSDGGTRRDFGPAVLRPPSPADPLRCFVKYAFVCLSAFTCLIGANWSLAASDVEVTNHEPRSTVRYSVVLLEGTIGPAAGELNIKNLARSKRDEPIRAVQHEGRFRSLVPLAVGRNRLMLSAEGLDKPVKFELTYRPQTNPYYVRLVWMTDSSGDTRYAAPDDEAPQDYENRLRTAALLMQTFTAERMHQLGYGRRTFRLEHDRNGQVVVHTLAGPKTMQEYHDMPDRMYWYGHVNRWINREHPDDFAKNMLLAAYTRKDPETGEVKSHTALGGGNLGLFGSASCFAWPASIGDAADTFLDDTKFDPSRVNDDSVGRSTIWGLASTTIGATLHEMGHTFGLPHCTDPHCIMTRGFDHFNRCFTFHDPPSGRRGTPYYFKQGEEAYFAPVSASYLRWSPWFQGDAPIAWQGSPKIELVGDRVLIACEAGIPWVGFHAGGNIQDFEEYAPASLPRQLSFTLAELQERLGGKQLESVRAIGPNGREAAVRVPAG